MLAMVHVNVSGKYTTFDLKLGANVTVSGKLSKGTNADPVKNLVVYSLAYSLADIKDITFGDTAIPAILKPIIEGLITESAKAYNGSLDIPIPNFSFEGSSLQNVELMVKDGHVIGQVGVQI